MILNPSATWSAKAWPNEHFSQLSKVLTEQLNADVLIAWGPGEEVVRDAIIDGSQGTARAIPATSLQELAVTLGSADLLVTTDSGPKHIAVAEGTPTLTLFGSTNPTDWQPQLPSHRFLTHEVDCHPCDLLVCPLPGHPCLGLLTPDRVAAEVRQMLKKNG